MSDLSCGSAVSPICLTWLAIVARKYVFSRRKAEKLRSATADGTTSSNLVKRQTQEVFP